jgi:hypothetical protein
MSTDRNQPFKIHNPFALSHDARYTSLMKIIPELTEP